MRKTKAQVAVARVLLGDGPHWGYPIWHQADIKSGVLYPILARFEAAGWVDSYWGDPDGPRPRRRYYTVTDTGREALTALTKEKP